MKNVTCLRAVGFGMWEGLYIQILAVKRCPIRGTAYCTGGRTRTSFTGDGSQTNANFQSSTPGASWTLFKERRWLSSVTPLPGIRWNRSSVYSLRLVVEILGSFRRVNSYYFTLFLSFHLFMKKNNFILISAQKTATTSNIQTRQIIKTNKLWPTIFISDF